MRQSCLVSALPAPYSLSISCSLLLTSVFESKDFYSNFFSGLCFFNFERPFIHWFPFEHMLFHHAGNKLFF